MHNSSTNKLQMPYQFLRILNNYRPRVRRRLERHLDDIVRTEQPMSVTWSHMERAIARMHYDYRCEGTDETATDAAMCEHSLESFRQGRYKLIEDVIDEVRRRPA